MRTSFSRFVVAAPALVIALLTLASCSDSEAQRVDWTVVQNRLWIERMPKDARDIVKQLVLIDDDGQRVGIAGASSRFRFFFDMLVWEGKGDSLRAFFPQDRKEVRAKVRAWSCAGKAPEPFELCLELQDQSHKRVYFSRKDWVIETLADAEALARTLTKDDAPTLGGTLTLDDAPSANAGSDVDVSVSAPSTFPF